MIIGAEVSIYSVDIVFDIVFTTVKYKYKLFTLKGIWLF